MDSELLPSHVTTEDFSDQQLFCAKYSGDSLLRECMPQISSLFPSGYMTYDTNVPANLFSDTLPTNTELATVESVPYLLTSSDSGIDMSEPSCSLSSTSSGTTLLSNADEDEYVDILGLDEETPVVLDMPVNVSEEFEMDDNGDLFENGIEASDILNLLEQFEEGIAATDVCSLLEQFEEAESVMPSLESTPVPSPTPMQMKEERVVFNLDPVAGEDCLTECEKQAEPESEVMKLLKAKNPPQPNTNSPVLTPPTTPPPEVLKKIKSSSKRKSAIMLPNAIPARAERGSAVAMPAGANVPRRLQRIMGQQTLQPCTSSKPASPNSSHQPGQSSGAASESSEIVAALKSSSKLKSMIAAGMCPQNIVPSEDSTPPTSPCKSVVSTCSAISDHDYCQSPARVKQDEKQVSLPDVSEADDGSVLKSLLLNKNLAQEMRRRVSVSRRYSDTVTEEADMELDSDTETDGPVKRFSKFESEKSQPEEVEMKYSVTVETTAEGKLCQAQDISDPVSGIVNSEVILKSEELPSLSASQQSEVEEYAIPPSEPPPKEPPEPLYVMSYVNEEFNQQSGATGSLFKVADSGQRDKRSYRRRDSNEEQFPAEEEETYYDKLPNYFTALSKPAKPPLKHSDSASRYVDTSLPDRDRDPSPDRSDPTYNKLPEYYSCFTNSTRYDNNEESGESLAIEVDSKPKYPWDSLRDKNGSASSSRSQTPSMVIVSRPCSRPTSRPPSRTNSRPSRSRSSSSNSSCYSRSHSRSRSRHNYGSRIRSRSRSSRSGYRSRSRDRSRRSRRTKSSRHYRRRRHSYSSCSSSRSRSRSTSRSRNRRRTYSRSWSRSRSRSRSRSHSRSYRRSRYSHSDKYRSRSASRERRWKEERLEREQRKKLQIEERRIVYVGKISSTTTRRDLRQLFECFGDIEEVSVHFREEGDNYGFVTFCYTCDAYAAIERGKSIHGMEHFDLCFGGRREFCKSDYADLDGSKEDEEEMSSVMGKSGKSMDFDELLRQAMTKKKKTGKS